MDIQTKQHIRRHVAVDVKWKLINDIIMAEIKMEQLNKMNQGIHLDMKLLKEIMDGEGYDKDLESCMIHFTSISKQLNEFMLKLLTKKVDSEPEPEN